MRLVLARRRAARHRGATVAALGLDLDFDGGVAARVEDFAGDDGVISRHERDSFEVRVGVGASHSEARKSKVARLPRPPSRAKPLAATGVDLLGAQTRLK